MAPLRSTRPRVACLVLLASPFGLVSCGLLQRGPDLPDPAAVAAARAADAAAWRRLEEVAELAMRDPRAAFDRLRESRREDPDDLRLLALEQDLQVRRLGAEAVLEAAEARYAEAPTPRSAWLLARVEPDPDRRAELVRRALDGDPDLLPARLLDLSLRARGGGDAVVDELVRFLGEHPGSAEGWRLLGRFGHAFARPDLVVRAAELEPWSSLQDEREVRLVQARALLDADRPEEALDRLAALPADDHDAQLLRAAAHVAAGRPRAGRAALERVLERDPDDAVALYDLGVLLRDHLDDPEGAAAAFRAFLERGRVPPEHEEAMVYRRVQVGYWLEVLDGKVVPPGGR